MKRVHLIWLKILVLSGIFTIPTYAQAPWKNSEHIILEERPVESFTRLEINGMFDIYLRQDSIEMLEMEGKQEALEMVEVYHKNDQLIIKRRMNWRLNNLGKIRLYISLDDLYKLEINGASNLYCEESLRFQELDFECNSVGKTELMVEAERLDIQTNTTGKVYLAGAVDTVYLNNNSLSKINAYDLYAQVLHLRNASMGGIRIRAEKELYIDSTGFGNIYCKGDPEVKRTNMTGFGKVKYL